MAKEQNSRFELNKGSNHDFDISKRSKRKFDLSKEQPNEAEDSAAAEPAIADGTQPTGNSNTAKSWILAAGGIILLILLGWWLWPSSTTQVAEAETIAVVEIPADTDATVAPEAVEENQDGTSEENVDATQLPENNETETVETTEEAAVTAPATTTASTSATTPQSDNVASSNDIEAEALKVIRGDYGDGLVRKEKLGANYAAIQKRVNELKREGAF